MALVKPCPLCGKSVSTIDNCDGDFAVVCDWGNGGCGGSGGYRASAKTQPLKYGTTGQKKKSLKRWHAKSPRKIT